MSESGSSSEANHQLDGEGLQETWTAWRSGKVVTCASCKGHIALSVDSASVSYRLMCTDCGHCSTWFEAPAGRIRLPSVTLAEGQRRR